MMLADHISQYHEEADFYKLRVTLTGCDAEATQDFNNVTLAEIAFIKRLANRFGPNENMHNCEPGMTLWMDGGSGWRTP